MTDFATTLFTPGLVGALVKPGACSHQRTGKPQPRAGTGRRMAPPGALANPGASPNGPLATPRQRTM
jgi:hypothetical protein